MKSFDSKLSSMKHFVKKCYEIKFVRTLQSSFLYILALTKNSRKQRVYSTLSHYTLNEKIRVIGNGRQRNEKNKIKD
jgi:hypothetical protein